MDENPQPPKKYIYKLVAVIIAIGFLGTAVFYSLHKQPGPAVRKIPSAQQPTTAPIKTRVRHVAIVVEENHSYSKVIGNTKDMPYLNSLANKYAYAKNYFANTHPSIGNYFILTTGDIITNNDSSTKTVPDDNIARHLISAGKTWKEYSETLPSVGYTGPDADPYEEHHNPFSYFSDVRDSNTQAANLLPLTQLAADIASHNLPDYSFIVPNNFNNAHDCPPQGTCNELAAADGWLKKNIDPLLNSPDFSSPGGGILIVTFDESGKSDKTHGGGSVAWIAAGPDVKKGYTSDTFYQHENTLRFMAETIGLNDFPGKAANAANMSEFLVGN